MGAIDNCIESLNGIKNIMTEQRLGHYNYIIDNFIHWVGLMKGKISSEVELEEIIHELDSRIDAITEYEKTVMLAAAVKLGYSKDEITKIYERPEY